MPPIPLKLPVIQNWSCHNCGGCCREHLIEITPEEKRRIEKQKWTAADGVCMDRPIIQRIAKDRYRLAHTADGACVFLNEDGLCRIHARHGEAAKPLACRVYPYAFHPAGQSVTVSLRFSCPSVVQNLGTPVTDQKESLQKTAKQITAGSQKSFDAPAIHGNQQLDWPDFNRFIQALDQAFQDTSVHFAVRLMRILAWLELVEQSQFETVRGLKLDDYLQLITQASVKAQPDNDLPVLKPGRIARIFFRQMVAQYSRHDTEATVRGGFRTRWKLLTTSLKFSFAAGRVPHIQPPASVLQAFPQTAESPDHQTPAISPTFGQLETPFSCRQPEIDELFTRYFRVKVQGIHFCGPAHYDTSLVDGFRSLALMYPVAIWLARLRAAQQGNSTISLQDAQAALATADHNFGYSPALGMSSALNRIRILGRMQQITRLCGWYTR
jgi:lysine-N-methylase